MVKEFKVKIKDYKQKLKKLRLRKDRHGMNQYNEARWAYLKLLEKKENFWQQRARQF